MVFTTSIPQPGKTTQGIESNESYRLKHGFKELDVHNSPRRKNPDFKPMLYGDFIGMLNFKLSEPWALLRHFPDLINEQHQMPILWIKSIIKGGLVGGLVGLGLMFNKNENLYVEKKLHLSHSQGPFSMGNFHQAVKRFYRPVGTGAAIAFAYHLAYDFFTHHKESHDIPDILTHFKIWALFSPVLISYFFRPSHAIPGMVFTLGFFFPIFHFMKQVKEGKNVDAGSYYFYQDSVSKAEKDKFEYQDAIEAIGFTRTNEYCYGLTKKR